MICEFFNWIRDFFINIYNKIKNFFTPKKDSETNPYFVDLEAGNLKREDTMDTYTPKEEEVGQFSDTAEGKDLTHEVSDEFGGYGKSSSDLSKHAWSSDHEDPIDEEGLVDEFTEKCAIEGDEDKPESFEISDVEASDDVVDVEASDEVVDEPEAGPEDCVEETTEESPETVETCEDVEEVCPVTDDTTEPEPVDDSEIVQVEGVDIESIELALESSDDEELEIPKVEAGEDVETSKKGPKSLTQKLNWEAKASVPKYSLMINSKLNKEDIQKASITTKGKAEKLAKAKTEINQSKAKIVKDQFKKDVEDKRTADQIARAKIVEKERTRVAEAKKKKELAAEKLRKEASERYQREKEQKEKEKAELEAKRKEFNRAKVEAIKSSKK